MLTKLILPSDFSLINSACFISPKSIAVIDASGKLAIGSLNNRIFKLSCKLTKIGLFNLEQPVAIDRVDDYIAVSDWLNYRVCFLTHDGSLVHTIGLPALSENFLKNAKLATSQKNLILCHRTGDSVKVSMNNSRIKKFMYYLYGELVRKKIGFKKVNGVSSLGGALFFSDKNAKSVIRYFKGVQTQKYLGERLGNITAHAGSIYVCLEAQRRVVELDFNLNLVRTIYTKGSPFTIAFHGVDMYYGGLDGLFKLTANNDTKLESLTDVHGIDVFEDQLLIADRANGVFVGDL